MCEDNDGVSPPSGRAASGEAESPWPCTQPHLFTPGSYYIFCVWCEVKKFQKCSPQCVGSSEPIGWLSDSGFHFCMVIFLRQICAHVFRPFLWGWSNPPEESSGSHLEDVGLAFSNFRSKIEKKDCWSQHSICRHSLDSLSFRCSAPTLRCACYPPVQRRPLHVTLSRARHLSSTGAGEPY